MKSFKYSVQSVLDLKIKFEEYEKTKLLMLKNELNSLFDELDALNNLYENSKREYRELNSVGTSQAKFAEMTLYLKEIDNKRALIICEIDKAQKKVEAQTDILKEINKEVKMLEKHREKQLSLYDQMVFKENELMIDDFLAGNGLKN